MMAAKEMKAYRDEKLQNLYKDNKYKSVLEYIEQKMISSIDKDPTIDMFTFQIPNDIVPSVILNILYEHGYTTVCNDASISIFL